MRTTAFVLLFTTFACGPVPPTVTSSPPEPVANPNTQATVASNPNVPNPWLGTYAGTLPVVTANPTGTPCGTVDAVENVITAPPWPTKTVTKPATQDAASGCSYVDTIQYIAATGVAYTSIQHSRTLTRDWTCPTSTFQWYCRWSGTLTRQ